MRRSTIIIGFAILALIVWAVLSWQEKNTDAIKVGFIGPLTGYGAAWGIPELNTTQLGFDEINANGGINGHPIKVIAEDGKCSGKDAVTAAHKLIEIDKVDLLFASCSVEVVSVAPLAEQANLLLFSAWAMSSNISQLGGHVFRTSYTNQHIAEAAAQLVRSQYATLATINEVTEFATDLRDAVQTKFHDRGGKIVASENFTQGATDVRAQVLKVLQAKPAAIFINPDSTNSALLTLRLLREYNYHGALFGTFFGGSPEVQKAPEADGLIFFSDPPVVASPEKEYFLAKYHERYGDYPGIEYPAAARWDTVKLMATAMRHVGTDTEAMSRYLHGLPSFTGILGTYHFDDHGDPVGIRPGISQIKNGEAIPYK